MSLFQRNVEELRIRAATSPDMSVQIMTLLETVCCMRMLAIVVPYTGQEIDPGKYCSRLVMPVAENQE